MCIGQRVEKIMIILMNCSVKYFVFKCERKPQITKWCASPPKSARGSTKRSRSRSAGMLSEAGQTMEMPSVMRHHGLLLGGPATSVVGCGGVVCQAEWQRAIPSRRWSGRRGSFTAKICPDRRAPDTLFTSGSLQSGRQHREAGGAVWHLGRESHGGDSTYWKP